MRQKLVFIGPQFHWNILKSRRILKYSGCRFQIHWGLNISSVRAEIFLNSSVKIKFPESAQPIVED